MLYRVAQIRTDVSDERISSIIIVTRISDPDTILTVTSNWNTVRATVASDCLSSKLSDSLHPEEWRHLGCYDVWLL
jgi:hypothetical protein